jgi:hypothetical protein
MPCCIVIRICIDRTDLAIADQVAQIRAEHNLDSRY